VLDLFSQEFDREKLGARISALSRDNMYVGTSSWKYPGWIGTLYDRSRYETKDRFSKRLFEDDCLEEYTQFFQTVCVDAGYYRFPDDRYIEKLAGQVPDNFRLTFKVTDTITLRRFPKLPRFGPQQGEVNSSFLRADVFLDQFLAPLEPYKAKIGALVFEFAEFRNSDFSGPDEFAGQLGHFLSQLPSDWQYGVEIRNRELLGDAYFNVLRNWRVAHVFNQWTRMPSVERQLSLPGSVTTDFVIGRFLLRPGRDYEDAVEAFSPYDQTRDVSQSARRAARRLIWDVPIKNGRPSFVYINNRLEGNALNTIWAITGDS
jgi:uncharacterized protein YecE (DUF72 family)